ncbi:MAG: membrane protein insertase YidC [Marmoricola sp.]
MSFFSEIGHFIMTPLYYLVSVVLVGFHDLFGKVFDGNSAWAWGLSVVGLTVVIRAALLPLFAKQIKSSRNMQLLQPKVKELQKKYGHDRERLSRETMALYKETGTNPFASCLPLIVQMPIFWALFRLIDHAAKNNEGNGVLTNTMAASFAHAPFFGGTLANSFTSSAGHVSIQIVAAVLIVVMIATTFLTQRQLMSKNMPADAMSGQYAQQQKMLLYVLPLVFAVGGVAFPIGVIFYWCTSNIWTMGQQFYVIRNNPAPGTPAFAAKEKRDRERQQAKGVKRGRSRRSDEGPEDGSGEVGAKPNRPGDSDSTPARSDRRPAQRQQPKRQSREQRKKSGPPSGPDQQNSDHVAEGEHQ